MTAVAIAIAAMMIAVPLIAIESSDGAAITQKEYHFYLYNSVDGEDSSVNGWYTGQGNDSLYALIDALNGAKVTHTITHPGNSNGYTFIGNSISDWSSSWNTGQDILGANYAIWNWNPTDGWHTGNVFGTACGQSQPGHASNETDTVFLISHENYASSSGQTAANLGIEYQPATSANASTYFNYTKGELSYADADEAALAAWANSFGYTPYEPEKYGLAPASGYETFALAWAAYEQNGLTKAITDASGLASGYVYNDFGYVQMAPKNAASTPDTMIFGAMNSALGSYNNYSAGSVVYAKTNTYHDANAEDTFAVSFYLNKDVAPLTKYYFGYSYDILFDSDAVSLVSVVDATGKDFTGTSNVLTRNVGTLAEGGKLFTATFKIVALASDAETSVAVGVYNLPWAATSGASSPEGTINEQVSTAGVYDIVTFINKSASSGNDREITGLPGDIVSISGTTASPAWATYDPDCLRFLSMTDTDTDAYSVSNDGNGKVMVYYNDGISENGGSGMTFTLNFAVKDNAKNGTTTVNVYNSTSDQPITTVNYDIVTTSFIITPDVVSEKATVSMYNVPGAAGLKLDFTYTGNEKPIIENKLASGSFSTTINETSKTFTVIWASAGGIDSNVNSDIFTISGCTAYTLRSFEIVNATGTQLFVGDYDSMSAALEATGGDGSNNTFLIGDVGCTGKITVYDLVLLTQYIAGKTELSTQGLVNADIFQDGKIDISDAMALSRILATA